MEHICPKGYVEQITSNTNIMSYAVQWYTGINFSITDFRLWGYHTNSDSFVGIFQGTAPSMAEITENYTSDKLVDNKRDWIFGYL